MREPIPLSRAVDAVERGIERRSARVWAPRWVGLAIALRGVTQPLLELNARRDPATLSEALRLADSGGGDRPVDPVLGVAAQALGESPERAVKAR
jgi:hypothetical protein